MFTFHRYVYGSGGARCALSVCRICAFLNTYICTVLHTPGPDVAPSTPQQEMKSRAFHHSNSSTQSAEGGKPETCQVEQVRKQQFCLYGFTLILVSYLAIVERRVQLAQNICDFREVARFNLQVFFEAVHCKLFHRRHRRETRATELFFLTTRVCFDGKQTMESPHRCSLGI